MENASCGSYCQDEDWDEADAGVSLVSYWILVVGVGSLCLSGLVGNIITVVVLLADSKIRRKSTVIWLLGIAVTDAIFLLCTLWMTVLPTLGSHHGFSPSFFSFWAKLSSQSQYISRTNHLLNMWVTVGLFLERYIVVCHPLKAGLWCSIKRSLGLLVIIIVFCSLFCLPILFEFEEVSAIDTTSQRLHFKESNLRASTLYKWMYMFALNMMFRFAVPFGLIIFMAAKVIDSMTKSKNFQQQVTFRTKRNCLAAGPGARNSQSVPSPTRNEKSVTQTCVAIVVVFLVCQLPVWALGVINQLEDVCDWNILQDIPRTIADFAVIVLLSFNSSFNFVIYIVMNRSFRKTLCYPFRRFYLCSGEA